MHELSVALALLEQVEAVAERNRAERVSRVTVTVGALSGVDPAALRLAFPVAAEETRAAAARLDIVDQPARARCRDCGHESAPEFPLAVCAACGSTDAEILGGRDLVLTSVELDTADPET